MAEEIKQETMKCGCKNTSGVILKTIIGLAFLALGAFAIINWFDSLAILFKGSIGIFLTLAGLIFLLLAKE